MDNQSFLKEKIYKQEQEQEIFCSRGSTLSNLVHIELPLNPSIPTDFPAPTENISLDPGTTYICIILKS